MISKKNAIKVEQEFGPFYVVKFKAIELLELAYSDPLRKEGDKLRGNQRIVSEKRRKEIRNYINSSDCAFPNNIILAANFPKDGNGQIELDEKFRWEVSKEGDNYYLTIPTSKPMAVIIDGQHRLRGFDDATPNAKEMELICSVYLDLPSSLQAFLFATINSTQKAVNKSQAYELFGFDLDDESSETWSPDKLAISLCRKLNNEPKAPFYRHIKPGAITDFQTDNDIWQISTACIVDCILRLITTKPVDDKSALYTIGNSNRFRIRLESVRKDNSPLRDLYLNNHDGVIYRIICNFFNAAESIFNQEFREGGSALTKTVGIQGLFDVLKQYVNSQKGTPLKEIDFTENAFKEIFDKSKGLDFSNDIFMKFSGVGRARVRDAVLVAAGYKEISDVSNDVFREWLSGETIN